MAIRAHGIDGAPHEGGIVSEALTQRMIYFRLTLFHRNCIHKSESSPCLCLLTGNCVTALTAAALTIIWRDLMDHSRFDVGFWENVCSECEIWKAMTRSSSAKLQ